MQANDISFWSPCRATLEVLGPDATSFLHRLSTQNVFNMHREEVFQNCFLNSKGRLVDAVYQKLSGENSWLLMSSHSSVNILRNWLESYCFSENLEIQRGDWGKEFPVLDQPSEKERIARCIPRAPNEINDSTNPLELGLGALIAWNKGCYMGQEVISRLATYNKVSRILVALSCEKRDFEGLKASPEISTSLEEFEANQALALGLFRKTALTSKGFVTTENGTPVRVVSSAR